MIHISYMKIDFNVKVWLNDFHIKSFITIMSLFWLSTFHHILLKDTIIVLLVQNVIWVSIDITANTYSWKMSIATATELIKQIAQNEITHLLKGETRKTNKNYFLRALSHSLPRLKEIRWEKENWITWLYYSTRVFLRFFSIIIKTPYHQ